MFHKILRIDFHGRRISWGYFSYGEETRLSRAVFKHSSNPDVSSNHVNPKAPSPPNVPKMSQRKKLCLSKFHYLNKLSIKDMFQKLENIHDLSYDIS